MTKKILFFAMAALTAIQPFSFPVKADSGIWEPIQATEAWEYDQYKVEKVSFDSKSVGPISLGSVALMAEPVASCEPTGCDRYDVYVLKDGMRMFIGNLPAVVLDEQRYLANDEEFLYVDTSDFDQNHWNVVRIDLTTGEEQIVAEDLFMDGVEEMDVLASDGKFYLNPSFNWNDHQGYSQGTIYVYDPKIDDMRVVPDHWLTYRDELQDVQDGIVLSRLVFSNGYKQLWVYDTNKDPVDMRAVPGSWTPSHEDIVGAHFRSDGTVEYFQMYQRYVYDGTQAMAQDDYLSWNRATDDAMQIVGDRMAWLDPNDVLRVSDVSGVRTFGTIGTSGTFRLIEDTLFYASSDGEGKLYDFTTGETSGTPFIVLQKEEDAMVGVDEYGNIWYENIHSGVKIKIGFGTDPVLADETHIYWRGSNGNVYEATIAMSMRGVMAGARPVKIATDTTVYAVANGMRYTIPNEKIYLSWFGGWNALETISEREWSSYADGGVLGYAPGSRLKLANDPKVYVVGTDGSIHWVTTQTIAYAIFGSSWNRGIIEITQMDLVGLRLGSSVMDEQDIQSI